MWDQTLSGFHGRATPACLAVACGWAVYLAFVQFPLPRALFQPLHTDYYSLPPCMHPQEPSHPHSIACHRVPRVDQLRCLPLRYPAETQPRHAPPVNAGPAGGILGITRLRPGWDDAAAAGSPGDKYHTHTGPPPLPPCRPHHFLPPCLRPHPPAPLPPLWVGLQHPVPPPPMPHPPRLWDHWLRSMPWRADSFAPMHLPTHTPMPLPPRSWTNRCPLVIAPRAHPPSFLGPMRQTPHTHASRPGCSSQDGGQTWFSVAGLPSAHHLQRAALPATGFHWAGRRRPGAAPLPHYRPGGSRPPSDTRATADAPALPQFHFVPDGGQLLRVVADTLPHAGILPSYLAVLLSVKVNHHGFLPGMAALGSVLSSPRDTLPSFRVHCCVS